MDAASYERLVGGSVMRRLPKIRASTEYAPGPRSARIPLLTIEITKCKQTLGSAEWTVHKSKIIIRIVKYGVRMPVHRLTTIEAQRKSVQGELTSLQCAAPSRRNVPATTTLKNKSAMPGRPVGNIENNLCTVERVTFFGYAANLQSRVLRLFFRGGESSTRIGVCYCH
jgi:hypothetical protein